MKQLPKFLIAVLGCELVGLISTPFTISAIPSWYVHLQKPFFAPPNWVFGPVWTFLYFLMGISVFLIWNGTSKKKKRETALHVFMLQLALNFIWTPVFFGLRSPAFGLVIIVGMWSAIVVSMKKFYGLNKTACYLLAPYLAWVTFATLLNAAILLLN